MFEIYIRREGFFAFFEDIGPLGSEGSFQLFDAFHIASLAAITAVTILSCVFYKKLGQKNRRRVIIAIALTVAAMEAFKQLTFLFLHGQYWPFLAPLHLCDIAIFINIIHAFRPNKTTREILYTLCLPGAIASQLFSTWVDYPIMNYYFINSLIIHTLHIIFVFLLLTSGEMRPGIRQMWRPAVFLAVVTPLIYLYNVRFDTNFFFVNAGSEGSPLEFFVNAVGIPWFLLPYAALVLIVWVLMYLPFLERGRKRRAG
jgi:hypothetical integral membrane protein (TIGR02206 family)